MKQNSRESSFLHYLRQPRTPLTRWNKIKNSAREETKEPKERVRVGEERRERPRRGLAMGRKGKKEESAWKEEEGPVASLDAASDINFPLTVGH